MHKFLFLSSILLVSVVALRAQQHSMSVGIYSGISVPYTFDKGINEDPRYKAKYEIKAAPIGFAYGMDYEGFGFLISPGLYSLGQNFYVVNTAGGQNGLREIDLKYINLPFSFKLHVINLSFFRVSAVASLSGAFLLEGKERISHTDTKLTFPKQVYPILPSDYKIEYDGVLVPAVNNYTMLSTDDFNAFQFFAGAGIRSDWDVSNHWRISFDFRFNYGLLEPRADNYLIRQKNYKTLYDTPGKRNDMFANFSVGISRYIDFDKKDKGSANKIKDGGSKKFKTTAPPNKPKPKAPSKKRPRPKATLIK